MAKALQEAVVAFDENEVPVGAVITHKEKVIAKAHNQVELLNDPTAHAEMIAITQAAAYLQSKWLKECTLYVTIEPCVMCAGALILSRIDRVVFGVCDPKTGAFGSKLDANQLKLNHTIAVHRGILSDQCALIIQQFFKNKR